MLYSNTAALCFVLAVLGGGTALVFMNNWPLAVALAVGCGLTGLVFQAVHDLLTQLRGIRSAVERRDSDKPDGAQLR